MVETELVETLGNLELGDRVRLTTSDDEAFEGPASPIDYVPDDSLRVEIRPANTSERYEIATTYDDGWNELTVRHVDATDADAEWKDVGTVERVNVRGEDEWEWGPSDG